MAVFVFPCDSLPLYQCSISNKLVDFTSTKYLLLNHSIALQIKKDSHIQQTDIIVPLWIFEFFSLNHGDKVSILPISSDEIKESFNGKISFHFIRSQSLLNFNEFTTTQFVIPGELSDQLDSNDENQLSNLSTLLPTLLFGYCLFNGTFICLQYLSKILIFRCEWEEEESTTESTSPKYISVGKTKSQFDLKIIKPHKENNQNKEQEVQLQTELSIPPFMSIAYSKLSSLVMKCCSSSSLPWIGPHTFLVSAPTGSGKTTLLNNLKSTLLSTQPSTSIVSLSINLNSNNTFDNEDELSSNNLSNPFFSLLSLFVHSISDSNSLQTFSNWMKLVSQPNSNSNNNSSNNFPPLVLIIENIDSLLALHQDNSSSFSNELLLSTNYLLRLLNLLTSSTFSLPFCLLATTSLSESSISSKFLGTPGFESIITLPIPQLVDREVIFQSIFQSIHHEIQQKNVNVRNIFGSIPVDLPVVNEGKATIDQWIKRCSLLTAGYLPGDLVRITQRMMTISSSQHITNELKEDYFNWNDFLTALNITPPNQLISLQNDLFLGSGSQGGIAVEGRSSKLSWKDFAGYENEKLFIQNLLNRFSHHESSSIDNLLIHDLGLPRGLLLCGDSGTGKSYLARIIAAEAKMNFITIHSASLLSKYFGETEASIRHIFQKARSASPCVLFFDDFDVIAHNRGFFDPSKDSNHEMNNDNSNENSVIARVLSTFLNELDGISTTSKSKSSSQQVFVLAACTNLNNLDKALLRPGRLSYHLTLYPPSREDVKKIIEYHLVDLPVDENVSIDDIVSLYCNQHESEDDYNVNEITSICNEVRQLALFESIRSLERKNGQEILIDSEEDLDGKNENENKSIEMNGEYSLIRMEHFEQLLKPQHKFSTTTSTTNSSAFPSSVSKPFSFSTSSFQCDSSKPYSF